MALDVSTFVDIRTQQSTGGVPSVDFGRGLLVTIDPAIAAGGAGKAHPIQQPIRSQRRIGRWRCP